jgi:hypothetical protein
MAQVVEHLPTKHETLSSNPVLQRKKDPMCVKHVANGG